MNAIAAHTSTQSAPVSLSTTAAGMPPIAPAAMLMSARREFAVTSAASSGTIAGTSALFATWCPLASTSTPNANGKSSSVLTFPAIRTHNPARPKHPALIKVRRPPRLRSRRGPMTGATSAKGATVSNRYSRTLGRAAPGEMLKNNVPARATVTHASPIMLTAWATASRPNGDSPIVRGSCIGLPISLPTIVGAARERTPGPRGFGNRSVEPYPLDFTSCPRLVHPAEVSGPSRVGTVAIDAQATCAAGRQIRPPAPPDRSPDQRSSAAPRPVLPRNGSRSRPPARPGNAGVDISVRWSTWSAPKMRARATTPVPRAF